MADYSFGGTPKARQPLLLSLSVSLSLCLSRSHVHTSGTKPAVCLLGFLVITLTVNPLNQQRARHCFDLGFSLF